MVDLIAQIVLILLLAFVFFQDLKWRAIHVLLPVLILIVGGVIYSQSGYPWQELLFSSLFLLITLGGLCIYLFIRNKSFKRPFRNTLGLGDVLFFVAVLPLFSMHNYILFFITGMLFSIIGFMVIQIFRKTELVPLAGLLALYLVLLRILSYSTNFDFFYHKII